MKKNLIAISIISLLSLTSCNSKNVTNLAMFKDETSTKLVFNKPNDITITFTTSMNTKNFSNEDKTTLFSYFENLEYSVTDKFKSNMNTLNCWLNFIYEEDEIQISFDISGTSYFFLKNSFDYSTYESVSEFNMNDCLKFAIENCY